jgi:hypothetical protein
MPLRICLNCIGRLIHIIDTIAASLFPLSDGWLTLSVISSGHPLEIDKPHFLSQAAENNFLKFKG